jgi:hypothetical protein
LVPAEPFLKDCGLQPGQPCGNERGKVGAVRFEFVSYVIGNVLIQEMNKSRRRTSYTESYNVKMWNCRCAKSASKSTARSSTTGSYLA